MKILKVTGEHFPSLTVTLGKYENLALLDALKIYFQWT